jgi:hypothetical protein
MMAEGERYMPEGGDRYMSDSSRMMSGGNVAQRFDDGDADTGSRFDDDNFATRP